MHTLCLLDIKTKEQNVENMMRGRKIYEPPRFMSTQVAADQLLQVNLGLILETVITHAHLIVIVELYEFQPRKQVIYML